MFYFYSFFVVPPFVIFIRVYIYTYVHTYFLFNQIIKIISCVIRYQSSSFSQFIQISFNICFLFFDVFVVVITAIVIVVVLLSIVRLFFSIAESVLLVLRFFSLCYCYIPFFFSLILSLHLIQHSSKVIFLSARRLSN